MRTYPHIQHALQMLFALFVCLGLINPGPALAQTVTPLPPPLEQRRELAMTAMQSPQAEAPFTLQPSAAQTVLYPWSRSAFQSFRDGNWEIYSGNDDGSSLARLTNNSATDMQPRINRGATRIAFASNRDGDYEIFTMNMDGSGLTQLTKNTSDDVYPVWSPDGQKIAFEAFRDGQPEIYVMNADGSQQTRLTNSNGYDGQPAWSPDGSTIVYISASDYNLYIMNANGTNSRLLYVGHFSADPVWSPSGDQIAFDADINQDTWQELMVYDIKLGSARQVNKAASQCDDWAGSWSPDSRFLAYTTICYVYDQDAWYWTNAHINALDLLTTNAVPAQIIPGNTEWNPDWQTTDPVVPSSNMAPLPMISPSPVHLQWSGTDAGISGLKSFDLQVKDGAAGTWNALFTDTSATSGNFTGVHGHTYYFRVRARSNSYNLQAWPADYEVATTVESLPPQTHVKPLPPYSSDRTATITWGGVDPGDSGIKLYDIQYRYGSSGWTDWLTNTQATSGDRSLTAGITYYFRCRATDNAGNVEDWPLGNEGDAAITGAGWILSGLVHDNAGAPVAGAQLTTTPLPFKVDASDIDGKYAAYGLNNSSPTVNLNWSRSGYGSLPATTVPEERTISMPDVTLPPADDVIQNGTFEAAGGQPANWQASGEIPTGVTQSFYHTGQSALSLERPDWPGIDMLHNVTGGLWTPEAKVAFDSQGATHVIWLDGQVGTNPNTVYYSKKPLGGAWSVPENLVDTGKHTDLYIVVDDADTVYAAWNGENGGGYRTKPKEGSWSSQVLIPYSFYQMRFVIDHSGSIQIAGTTSAGISYAVQSAGQWSAVTTIITNNPDPNGSTNSYPNLVVDPDGTAHLLWTEYSAASDKVFYAFKPKDGAWSSRVEIYSGQVVAYLDMAMDESGALYGVWLCRQGIDFASKFPGSDWNSPTSINPAGGDYPKVAAHQGKVMVMYSSNVLKQDVYSIYVQEKSPGANWSTPLLLSEMNSATIGLDLESASSGEFSLVWIGDIVWSDTGGGLYGKIKFIQKLSADQTGDARVAQTLNLPNTLTSPALAFFYQLQAGNANEAAGLSVILHAASGDVNLFSTQDSKSGWTFQTVDVSQWSGQAVSLEFKVHQVAGFLPTRALIDDVTLGSTYPDVWATSTRPSGHPGDNVTFTISCGNRGGAAASHSNLTVTLPAGLTFVSVDPMPTSQSPALTWDLGDLAPKSSNCSIQLMTQIDPGVIIPHELTADAQIMTDSTELEQANNEVHPVAVVPYYFVLVPCVKK